MVKEKEMSKKPVVLMILDGYGLNENHKGNAVYEAKTPVMDRLMKEYPFVKGINLSRNFGQHNAIMQCSTILFHRFIIGR